SDLFFQSANIGTRVATPVSFLVNPLRALECWREPPSTLVLAEWVTRMGEDLFYPPNVAGWPGGRAWLSTRTIIARANCMAAFGAGSMTTPSGPPDFESILAKHGTDRSPAGSVRFFSSLLFGKVDEKALHKAVQAATADSPLQPALISLLTGPQAHLH